MKLYHAVSLIAVGILFSVSCVAIDCPGAQVRRAWRDLTCAEQQQYLQAVTALKISGVYNVFVSIHNLNSATSHGRNSFLPWHRWYLWQFEKQLQSVSGNCAITVPYWDWERDYLDPKTSSPLRADTFGSFTGIKKSGTPANCVNEGIANFQKTVKLSDGTVVTPWATTVRSQGCLRRTFQNYALTSDLDVLNRILNNPNYASFRLTLEGAPHAGPHNFINEHMGTMHSPDDPLFFIHHANLDRIWAIWQDYYDFDLTEDYTAVHYALNEIDVPLLFSSTSPLDFTVDGVNYPRPRDLLKSYDGIVNVTYGNDYLAKLLIDVTNSTVDVDYDGTNNPNWVEPSLDLVPTRCGAPTAPVAAPTAVSTPTAPVPVPTAPVPVPTAPVPVPTAPVRVPTAPVRVPTAPVPAPSSCSRIGASCRSSWNCCSNICRNKKCASSRRILKVKPRSGGRRNRDFPPKFGNSNMHQRYKDLVEKNSTRRRGDIVCQLAQEDCVARNNPRTASFEWIRDQGFDDHPEVFNCHLKCKNTTAS